MSSRDGSERTDRPRRTPQTGRQPNQPRQLQQNTGATWDIDPAEIDRYLSGRPARNEGDAPAPERTTRTGQPRREGTADQIDRLRRAVSEGTQRASQAPRQRQTQQRPPQRTQPTQRTPAAGREQFTAPAPAQQPVRRQPARQEQPASRVRPSDALRQDPFADAPGTGDDDELYTDDPYLDPEYEDEWDEPAPRRTTVRKPQIRVSKPNLPRPTIPPAIANAALVNDRTSLALIGVGLFGLALMAIILSNRIDGVADVIATHVSASGALEDMKGRNALWRIPLLSTMLMVMNIVAAWFFATVDRFAARFILAASLVVQFVAWIALIRYLW